MNNVDTNYITEPLKLIGEGEYNLNALTEIEVTDSYLGIDQDIRGCQNEEPYLNCTTKHYVNNVLLECGCIPLNIRNIWMQLSKKVIYQNTPNLE